MLLAGTQPSVVTYKSYNTIALFAAIACHCAVVHWCVTKGRQVLNLEEGEKEPVLLGSNWHNLSYKNGSLQCFHLPWRRPGWQGWLSG